MSSIALLVLKTGQSLVSQTDELDHEPRVHCTCPYLVGGKTKVTLTPWPDYTEEDHILLRSEDLLTVCEPSPEVTEAYLKKLGKTLEDFKKEPKRVILNEEDNPHPILDGTDDEYEPLYREDPIY